MQSTISLKVLFLLSLPALPLFAQETASVLPAGFNRVRAVNLAIRTVDSKLDSTGNRTVLAPALNREVTAKDVAASSKEFNQLYNALNAVEPGLGDSIVHSQLSLDATISNNVTVLAFERGISSRFTVGLKAPILHQSVKAKFQADNEDNYDAVLSRLGGLEPLTTGVIQARTTYEQQKPTAESLFTRKGYEVPHDFSYTALGDVELGAKYQFIHTDYFFVSAILGTRLPTTTHKENYRNILDKGAGDKQTDLGAQLFADFSPDRHWTFGTSALFTVQLPDTQNRPAPKRGESGLTDLTQADRWTNVRRNLGDMIETEVSSQYYFGDRAWSTYAAYQFKIKQADKYSGGNADLDYGSLGNNSWMRQHRYEVGAGYSTIPAFRRKRFKAPIEVKVAYNDIFSGINTAKTSYVRFDLIGYF